MILITSAAYVGAELQSAFGRVPPCVLPLANRPILDYQVAALRARFPQERIVVSLPARFALGCAHRATFAAHGIEHVAIREGLTLADSVLQAINMLADEGDVLRILHGDTLIFDLPQGDDVIATGRTRVDYAWEIETASATEEVVWSGYFSFSSARQLSRCLALSEGRFAAAVHAYDAGRKLERAPVERWLDVGHINTFFASRETLTTERSFNSIVIRDGWVSKSGEQPRKIEAEIHWLRQVPRMVKLRTPQLLETGVADGKPYYVLEYLHLVPLNELFVHGRHGLMFWNAVYGHCDSFLLECRRAFDALPPAVQAQEAAKLQHDAQQLRVAKTTQRLAQFAAARGIDLDHPWQINGQPRPSLRAVCEDAVRRAAAVPVAAGVMHGDFCFSNILYDSRADAIKVIDPRGLTHAGELSIYGDLCYDIAKLSHSVIGLYDFILAGACTLNEQGPYQLEFRLNTDPWLDALQEAYLQRRFGGALAARDSLPLVILLFLSMLPLHADDPERQMALMANAFRLYAMLEPA